MNEMETRATLSPQQVARAYDRFVSARWRGEDEAADPVALWFEAHWVTEPSPEPETPPASASVLGASGRGIHWYERGDVLLGYVPGHDEGCYRVTAGEAMPAMASPWDAVPSPRLASDRLFQDVSAEPYAKVEGVEEADRVLGQSFVMGRPGVSPTR